MNMMSIYMEVGEDRKARRHRDVRVEIRMVS